MFCLDTREADLIALLGQEVGCHVQQLPVGDIWIGTSVKEEVVAVAAVAAAEAAAVAVEATEDHATFQVGLLIERKSIRDLEASILDGRYREQRGRILSYCNDKKTQPLYIIEGALSSTTGRLQKPALMKFINRLVLHYQIPVLHTESVKETAELIQTLIAQWKEDPEALQRKTDLVKVTDGLHVHKKVNTAAQFSIACLAQCPGLSVKMAEALLAAFGSLRGVMEAPVKEVEQVKVGNRKVGPVVSKRLHELLNA